MSAVELDEMFTASEISVQGSVAAGFEKVKDVFQAQFQRGEEISAQLCIYRRGKQVVDLWASRDDPSYSGDSLQTIWSSTKNLTSLAVAMLVDQGFLNFSDRISQHGQSLASVERPGSQWRTCSAMREACPLSLPSLIYRTASQRTYGTTVWRKSSRKSCHTGPKTAGENTTQSQEVLSFSLKGLIFLTWHFLAVILKIEKVP